MEHFYLPLELNFFLDLVLTVLSVRIWKEVQMQLRREKIAETCREEIETAAFGCRSEQDKSLYGTKENEIP